MKNYGLQVLAFAYRNALFAARNVFMVVEMVFWPAMGLISIGMLGGFLHLEEKTLGFVLTGAIASGVLQINQLDVGYSLLYDVWSKSMKHTFLSRPKTSAALLGAWAIGIVRGLLILAFLTGLSRWMFDFRWPAFWPTAEFVLGVFVMGWIAATWVWILILNYGQRAEISVWAMTYLLMIVCGLYYPVNMLPRPLQMLAQIFPLTYFLEAIRAEYGFAPLFAHGALKGWALSALYIAGGLWGIELSLLRARKLGMLVRLSE